MRHGPTAYNAADLLMGDEDPEPLAQAIEQATQLGRSIAGEGAIRVFSSPLRRAQMTARAMFPDAGMIVDERLRERGLGQWQGRAKDDLPQESLTPGRSIDLRVTPPGGESLEQFALRVRSLLEELAGGDEAQEIFLVTHNGVVRVAKFLTGHESLEDSSVTHVAFLDPVAVALTPEGLLSVTAIAAVAG
jgi:broad specificity phosphatase PhoE